MPPDPGVHRDTATTATAQVRRDARTRLLGLRLGFDKPIRHYLLQPSHAGHKAQGPQHGGVMRGACSVLKPAEVSHPPVTHAHCQQSRRWTCRPAPRFGVCPEDLRTAAGRRGTNATPTTEAHRSVSHPDGCHTPYVTRDAGGSGGAACKSEAQPRWWGGEGSGRDT